MASEQTYTSEGKGRAQPWLGPNHHIAVIYGGTYCGPGALLSVLYTIERDFRWGLRSHHQGNGLPIPPVLQKTLECARVVFSYLHEVSRQAHSQGLQNKSEGQGGYFTSPENGKVSCSCQRDPHSARSCELAPLHLSEDLGRPGKSHHFWKACCAVSSFVASCFMGMWPSP